MGMNRDDLVSLEGTLEHETEKAILVDFGGDDPVWIPKSMCEYDEPDRKGNITVEMKRSLAKEKDLI